MVSEKIEGNQSSGVTWGLLKSDIFAIPVDMFHFPSFCSFTLWLKGDKSGAMFQHYCSLCRLWLLSNSPLRSSPPFPSYVCYHGLHIFTVFPPNFRIPLAASGFALYHFGVVSEWQVSLQLSLFSWECYSISNWRNAVISLWNWW